MEAFKTRLIQEYVELDERQMKLQDFILKNPKFESLETEVQTSMLVQNEAMKSYLHALKQRMKLLGITTEEVEGYKHPYQNMSFGEALQALEVGKCVRRKSWGANEDGFNAFVMLLNVHVASHLPERFRAAVQFDGRSREITTEKQYLLVTPRFINDLDINWHATPYVPTWRDIRANDWVGL